MTSFPDSASSSDSPPTKVTRRTALSGLAASGLAASVFAGGARRHKQRIRVGQIGIGHAHSTKLSVYRESADYEVVGLVESDPRLRGTIAKNVTFKDVPLMTQEQLLNVADLDVVLVETRVNDLLGTAEACVNAGKHVHIDKPAGDSLPHFRRIVESAERQQLMIQMGYMYRYNPAIALLQKFLAEGWLGDVFEIHTVMSKVVPEANRASLAKFPGGVMFELGCHLIDLVVGVLGKPNSVTPFSQHVSPKDDGLVDNMLAVMEYDRAIASVKSSAVEVDGFARRHFVVCGTEGTFHIQPLDNPSARVALSKPRAKYQKGYQDVSFPKYRRYVADAADMASVLRGDKVSSFDAKHDLNVQEAVLRASGLPLN